MPSELEGHVFIKESRDLVGAAVRREKGVKAMNVCSPYHLTAGAPLDVFTKNTTIFPAGEAQNRGVSWQFSFLQKLT